MNLFLTLAFLFCIGSVLGWGLEVIFRRFFSAHHWVNPGFLVGPYLPLYGSSLCVLYLLAMLEPLMPGDSPWLKKILLFVVMALAITALEYVAGMIFIHGMRSSCGLFRPLGKCQGHYLSAVYVFLAGAECCILFPHPSAYFVGAALAGRKSGIFVLHRILLRYLLN